MEDFEEALRNIDIFLRILAKKISEDEDYQQNMKVEPMENLLRKKYIIEEQSWFNPTTKHLIPLPQLEEPLIDIFEDDGYVKIFVQCRCKEQKVTIHAHMDCIEVCRRECHKDEEGRETCVEKCQRLILPTKHLRMENMVTKCTNNAVFKIEIPKLKPMENCED